MFVFRRNNLERYIKEQINDSMLLENAKYVYMYNFLYVSDYHDAI